MTTRLPRECAKCGVDAKVLRLHAKCHPGAPLGLEFRKTHEDGRGIVYACCYIPDCALHVAAFEVTAVDLPAPLPEKASCDLCGDNDARRMVAMPASELLAFTAPFRLEVWTADGQRVLTASCYVEECARAFAAFTLKLARKGSP